MSTAPIVFLPEKDNGNWMSGNYEEDSYPEFINPITGDEAREFYEEILSRPAEQNNNEITSLSNKQHSRRKRSGKIPSENLQLKRKDKTKDKGASNSGSSIISGSQAFLYAQNNELELLKSALSGGCCDINMRDNFNWSLLMVASHAGHATIVRHLLCQGARWKDVVDKSGRNAVDLARLGEHSHVVDMLETSSLERECGELDGTTCVSTNRCGIKRHADLTRAEGYSKKDCHSFHCKNCQMTVTGNSKAVHDTSTVHLFSSCQHHQCADISYGITESNRGYQILLRSGWDPYKGLGPQKLGRMFPVKTVLKRDRLGFGLEKTKPRVTHFSAHDRDAIQTTGERHRSREYVPKTKKNILQDRLKDRQWEMSLRAILNESHIE